MSLAIRDARASDAAAWRRLWALYNQFYGESVPDAVTDFTWARILDPAVPVFSRLAVADGAVVGFAIGLTHEGTWVTTPVCYLEDLFVDPARRGGGVGRALLQDLMDLARANGWSRLYWHTKADNETARRLYDRVAPADDFVRYRLNLT